MGPYAETIVTTRKSDVGAGTDNGSGVFHLFIGLIGALAAYWIVAFMGLFILAHIGHVCVIGLGALGFWACAHYGTDRRIIKRRLKAPTISDDDRATIRRRLSGVGKN
jgi:hypothetical protein